MRLAVVYNPNDTKLSPAAYSWTYRDMFLAVQEKFAPVINITGNCDADSIDAEVILFYDVHSSHHIEIKNIEKHPAVKIEYFNDPHQKEQFGQYSSGQKFHKLSAELRVVRACSRGVKYIICPYKNGYEKYIAPYMGYTPLIWIPIAPKCRLETVLPLSLRRPEILASGHLWEGEDDFRPYEFRNWAYKQSNIYLADHAAKSDTPKGNMYQAYLSQFAGALALCDCYVVPKYIEIALAGCVPFCQMHDEFGEMGFEDGKNCIAVNKDNFNERVADFLANIDKYESIAIEARNTALRYTANKFADKLADEIYEILNINK